MIKLKKYCAFLLIASMILAGCGAPNNSVPTPPPAAVNTEEPNMVQPDVTETPVTDISWPEKSVEIIIPYNPGGDTDTIVRALSGPLGEALGVPVLLTTMTGASGTVASEYVRTSRPDGYTLLWHHNGIMTANIFKQYEFNHKDFEPACITAYTDAYYLVSNPKKWATFNEFVEYARANPGKGNVGAPTGSFSYLIFVTILGALNLDVNIVDITGQTEGAIELVAERLDVTCGSAATYGDYLPSGQLIPILTFGDARKEAYPDCPTAKELGYDKLAAYMQFGFFFPSETDQAIIDKFNEACKTAIQSDSYKETCATFAVDPVFYPKEEAKAQWNQMYDFFAGFEEYFTW